MPDFKQPVCPKCNINLHYLYGSTIDEVFVWSCKQCKYIKVKTEASVGIERDLK